MRVLVTGATGTFGRRFLARVLAGGLADRVVALARGEHALAALAAEHPGLVTLIADVRDAERLHDALYRVDTIVHAAALKRVEGNDPLELLKTNVQGTANVVRAAIARGVGRVLVLSTDKCAAPATAYGYSKALAESYAVYANRFGHPRTRIACLRYGNVVGSRGSVLDTWRRQAAAGEPLTVTDPEATRFWLTIDQAVDYALEALERLRGGEVFVPAGLPTATVSQLASAVAGDGYPVRRVGMRAGEKRHEVLISADEADRALMLWPHFWVLEPPSAEWPYDFVRGGPRLVGELSSASGWRLTAEELRAMVKATEA